MTSYAHHFEGLTPVTNLMAFGSCAHVSRRFRLIVGGLKASIREIMGPLNVR